MESASASSVYARFRKGINWFSEQYRLGGMNPFLRTKLAEFWREVVGPMDEAFKRLSQAERKRIEREYVPF